ncbi:MAG: CRISPR-associated endonuclease Cas2 [Patescibacteria group bacterium]
MKTRTFTEKILEIAAESAVTAVEIITAVLESGYGASYSKINKNLNRLEAERMAKKTSAEERHRLYNLISKLKREGLVSGKKKISTTQLGRTKLTKLKSKSKYYKENDETTKIVVFDIPEKNKSKRDWLRKNLVDLGFKMLQKSVWIGKVKIPEEFIDDVQLLKIIDNIHIFTADKLGSIEIDK